ncbi:hypothetical protein QTP88_009121 [Uroleucon formosanum]
MAMQCFEVVVVVTICLSGNNYILLDFNSKRKPVGVVTPKILPLLYSGYLIVNCKSSENFPLPKDKPHILYGGRGEPSRHIAVLLMDFGFSGEGGSCEFLNYACELHAKYLHNLFMDFSLGGGGGQMYVLYQFLFMDIGKINFVFKKCELCAFLMIFKKKLDIFKTTCIELILNRQYLPQVIHLTITMHEKVTLFLISR